MLKSLNTAATGMAAQQTNMDVIANNIANSSTSGFKKSRAEFEDLMYQTQKEPGAVTGMNSVSPNGVQTGLGVRTAAIQKDFENGNAQVTKNPFDIQVEGAGFFRVMTGDGEVAYTRDGSFKKDPTGRLIDKNGNTLQPEITIPAGTSGVEISPTGEVRAVQGNEAPQVVGNIDLTTFVNPAGLKAMGKNLFTQTPASGQPVTSRPGLNGTGYLAQGQLESSNVNIVDEMVNMITAQRAYETNSKVIQASDQMLQSINNLR
ncbi:flagellar basal-body rod protein FlgG [Bdellovibrio sp. ZAP7]|jgi:flagellar basal-body rod protein FlgG|uniref:flagellar basal-body rod protein FlgG n=1 Tax=Bdellovibrio sp. ZAP7 TaxID=2231053 RepID=UPI001157E505|nr:flagellar basal-body rod protein FlgG [Bdellovibrio sp. ZAP7]QDK44079.1 flagellar basal-body rod protein FlgG [Bdellovibrio sp. ZAP7]